MSDNSNFVLQNFTFDSEDLNNTLLQMLLATNQKPATLFLDFQQQQVAPSSPVPQHAIILNNNNNNINNNINNIFPNEKPDYVDVSKFMHLPQRAAAKSLGIASSTFSSFVNFNSKRWRQSSGSRDWPYRNVRRIDKEIETINHNLPFTSGQKHLEMNLSLSKLRAEREEECRPVFIKIGDL